jgi:hypothetical protein
VVDPTPPRPVEALELEDSVPMVIRKPKQTPQPVFVYDLDAEKIELQRPQLPSVVEAMRMDVQVSSAPTLHARRIKLTEAPVEIDWRLWDALDRVHADVDRSADISYWAQLQVFALLLGTGAIGWLVRASSLLSGLIASLPAWLAFDPLPIVNTMRRRAERDEEEEFETWREGTELEDVFDGDAEEDSEEEKKLTAARGPFAP